MASTYSDIAVISVSIFSLIVSIIAVIYAKKQSNVATEQYQLSVEQHRQTLFSNIIVYPLQENFNLSDRQFVLGVTNTGKVPIVNIRAELSWGTPPNLINLSQIPITS